MSYHRFLSSALLPLREPPMPMPMPSSFKAGDHNTGSTPKWATPDYCSPQNTAMLQNQKTIALRLTQNIYQPKKMVETESCFVKNCVVRVGWFGTGGRDGKTSLWLIHGFPPPTKLWHILPFLLHLCHHHL